ncbi:MAG: hypothetical protein AAGH92_09935 [Planctomycetota bacterium]
MPETIAVFPKIPDRSINHTTELGFYMVDRPPFFRQTHPAEAKRLTNLAIDLLGAKHLTKSIHRLVVVGAKECHRESPWIRRKLYAVR